MIYISAYEPHRSFQIYQRYAYTILYIYRANIRLVLCHFDRYNARQDLSRYVYVYLLFYQYFIDYMLNDELRNI